MKITIKNFNKYSYGRVLTCPQVDTRTTSDWDNNNLIKIKHTILKELSSLDGIYNWFYVLEPEKNTTYICESGKKYTFDGYDTLLYEGGITSFGSHDNFPFNIKKCIYTKDNDWAITFDYHDVSDNFKNKIFSIKNGEIEKGSLFEFLKHIGNIHVNTWEDGHAFTGIVDLLNEFYFKNKNQKLEILCRANDLYNEDIDDYNYWGKTFITISEGEKIFYEKIYEK